MVYRTTEDCAGSGEAEDRLHKCIVYKQLFMEYRDRYRDYIPLYTDGSRDGSSVACATVFPPDTVIPMRLSDSASIFTADVCAIMKALVQMKDSFASKYIIFYKLNFRVSKLYNILCWNIP